jgi:hypothetical protein
MRTHIAVHRITGAPRIEPKKDKDGTVVNAPRAPVQTVAAGQRFNPREFGIDNAALKRMIKRGAVRKVDTDEAPAPASDQATGGTGTA